MSRNRIFYQVEALYAATGVNPTGFHYSSGASGVPLIAQLERVQSIGWSFDQPRETISAFGQLAPIDRIITAQPTVNLETNWLVSSLANESYIGLVVTGGQSAIQNILNQTQNVRNYFIAVTPEGSDVLNFTGIVSAFSVLNAYLDSYKMEASVGGIPRASATFKALNFDGYTGCPMTNQIVSGFSGAPLNAITTNGFVVPNLTFALPPGVSGLADEVSALRANDITVNIGNSTIGVLASDLKLQSFNLGFNLNLTYLNKIGQLFAYSIQPKFPVTLNASITANLGDLASGDLASLICNDQNYTLTFTLNNPRCPYVTGLTPAITITAYGMKIDSQSSNLDIGTEAGTVTINYSSFVGSTTDAAHNLILSGIYT